MRLFDTHTHIYLPEFDDDREAVVARAVDAGVEKIILPACDFSSIQPMRSLYNRYPSLISMAAGLHPEELGDDPSATMDLIEAELIAHRSDYVAVGEIGIDLYRDKSRENEQMQFFERQLKLAATLDLPVIIHCREALPQVTEVLEGVSLPRKGVFHSFTGTVADVETIRRRAGDFYFGLNGVATFKNCHVTDAIEEIGLGRLVLETDAPYLAPVPHRGRRNEPAYVADTARFIASAIGVAAEELAGLTTRNAVSLFVPDC